jgi:hypothetical protein
MLWGLQGALARQAALPAALAYSSNFAHDFDAVGRARVDDTHKFFFERKPLPGN